MTLNTETIEIFFFRFLNKELSVKDFEQWLYSTPQIEEYVGESAYLELISFNFQQPATVYEFSKILYQHISPSRFYNWRIKRLLKSLVDDTQDPVDVFENLYELYCRGYWFLGNIGIQYVVGIDEIPRLTQQPYWDDTEFFRRRKMLDEYLTPLKEEIDLLLEALESGDISILNEREYSIKAELSQKLDLLHHTSRNEELKNNTQPKKPWWKFWVERMRDLSN